MKYESTLPFARNLDQSDPLKKFRQLFHQPQVEVIYLCGNSLGLQPKSCAQFVEEELHNWSQLAVEGHFQGKYPWYSYHETVSPSMAAIVGAKTEEVIAMNSLTVNLHLLMVSFYTPTPKRYKIVIEEGAFPSDLYAVQSQILHHGLDPKTSLIELKPRPGEELLREEDILQTLSEQGEQIALVLLGGVNFRTGQAFPLAKITQKAKEKGCRVGFDLAHAAGNLHLKLHDWDVDFAVWCTYKYLNSGPGGIGGAFVHQRHFSSPPSSPSSSLGLKRFAGWWGHDKTQRFRMDKEFSPMASAEGWQLSNPPIFQLATLRSSLSIFDQTTMGELRKKSEQLTGLLEYLLKDRLGDKISMITPADPEQRGCQLSLKLTQSGQERIEFLKSKGVICDFRPPNILRASPTPLYNTYEEVWRFVDILAQL